MFFYCGVTIVFALFAKQEKEEKITEKKKILLFSIGQLLPFVSKHIVESRMDSLTIPMFVKFFRSQVYLCYQSLLFKIMQFRNLIIFRYAANRSESQILKTKSRSEISYYDDSKISTYLHIYTSETKRRRKSLVTSLFTSQMMPLPAFHIFTIFRKLLLLCLEDYRKWLHDGILIILVSFREFDLVLIRSK